MDIMNQDTSLRRHRHLIPQYDEIRQTFGRLQMVWFGGADVDEFPTVSIAPFTHDRAPSVTRLRILAVSIKKIEAEDWNLVDKSVATSV